MTWLRSRYFLPSLMVPLFLLAFIRADVRWRECLNGAQGICFTYPLYLSYESRQALDLHWPALLPAVLLNQLPESINPNPDKPPRTQRLRYVITVASVIAIWWLVGRWWERLLFGRRLSAHRWKLRWSILLLAGVLSLLGPLILYEGIRGGYEGPAITDAACIFPSMLIVMSLAECGVLARLLKGTGARIAIPASLLCLYAWADATYRTECFQNEARSQACIPQPGAMCITLPFFSPSPQILDEVALQLPPLLLASLPSIAVPSTVPIESLPAIAFSYVLVGLYWYTVVSLAQEKWPATTRVYEQIRTPLAVLCSIVFGFAFLCWMLGYPHHGSGGMLGLALGMVALIFAFRAKRKRGPTPAATPSSGPLCSPAAPVQNSRTTQQQPAPKS